LYVGIREGKEEKKRRKKKKKEKERKREKRERERRVMDFASPSSLGYFPQVQIKGERYLPWLP
jgi:hypothetical protein